MQCNLTLEEVKDGLIKAREEKRPYVWFDYRKIESIMDDVFSLCLDMDFEIHRKYEGESIFKCDGCDKWQESDNFEMIDPDDGGYFDCEYCNERNSIHYDEYPCYIRQGRKKFINYKPTNDIYIFDESGCDRKFNLDRDEIYVLEKDIDNPTELLHDCEMFVNYLEWEDMIETIQDVDECWRYTTYVVHHYMK